MAVHRERTGGGKILHTDLAHIEAKVDKRKKMLVIMDAMSKFHLEELNEQINLDRKVPRRKSFNRKEDFPEDFGTTRKIQSIAAPDG